MNANFYLVGKRKRAGGAFGDARQQLHVPVETCDIKRVANEFDAVVFIYDTDEELDVFKKLAQGLNNFCRRGNVINEFVKACDVVSRCEDQVCFVIEKKWMTQISQIKHGLTQIMLEKKFNKKIIIRMEDT